MAKQVKNGDFQMPPVNFFLGKVVDIDDPEKMGRVKVRIYGHHTPDEEKISKDDLVWATVGLPVTEAGISGIGKSPTGLVAGADIAGFFTDGEACQMPLVLWSIPAKPKKPDDKSGGFKDPNKVYPKYEDEESDVNRLARNENIDKTIVKKKKDGIKKKIPIANSDKTWDEPTTKYDAKYPYNDVYESHGGIIREFDDTKDAERIHEYHPKGTFYEIYPEGSKVTKIVKDNFEVILGNDWIFVDGTCNVTINKDCNLLVKGDCNEEVQGNKATVVKGNYSIKVKGDYSIKTEGSHNSTASGIEKRKASKIYLN